MKDVLKRLFGKNEPRPVQKAAASESLVASIPIAVEDVPDLLRGAEAKARALAEYCCEHELTFVGIVAPNLSVCQSVVGGTNAIMMPIIAGYSPVAGILASTLR